MIPRRRHIIFHLLGIAALAAIGLWALSGQAEGLLRSAVVGSPQAGQAAFLDDAVDDAMAGFLVLSGIKGGLAVVEGSNIGIGFNLQIGDIVQPIYDYVDIAWKTVIAGGTIVMLIKLMLASLPVVGRWLLAIAAAVLILKLTVAWLPPQMVRTRLLLTDAATVAVTLVLLCLVLIPLSIRAAAGLSRVIAGPVVADSRQALELVARDLSPQQLNRRFLADPTEEDTSLLSPLGIKAKVDRLRDRMDDISAFFKEKTRQIARLTLKLVAGYLFNCFVFPLAVLVMLWAVLKIGLGYLIGLNRQFAFSNTGTAEVPQPLP